MAKSAAPSGFALFDNGCYSTNAQVFVSKFWSFHRVPNFWFIYRLCDWGAYIIIVPPATGMARPVRKSASSEARKATVRAMSWG